MSLRDAVPPNRLWRIGRYPDPFAWTPWEHTGAGRFDDPRHEFRALYAAEQRLACFLETLAPFRADVRWLAEVQQLPIDPDDLDGLRDAGRVPDDWHLLRRVAWLECRVPLPALDLRALETRESLRVELARWLRDHGYRDFDLSDVLNRDRDLTQHVARWAYDRGDRAIAYTSRFGTQFDCWVLFGGQPEPEELPFIPRGVAPIARDDPDLVEAVRLFGLVL